MRRHGDHCVDFDRERFFRIELARLLVRLERGETVANRERIRQALELTDPDAFMREAAEILISAVAKSWLMRGR